MVLKEALKMAIENKKITNDCEANDIYNICKEIGYLGTEEEFKEEFLSLIQGKMEIINSDDLSIVAGGKNSLINRIGACSLSALGALSMVSSAGAAVVPAKRRPPLAPAISTPQVVQQSGVKKSVAQSAGNSWNFIKLNPKLAVAIAVGLPAVGIGGSVGGKKLYDHMTYKNIFICKNMEWKSNLNNSFKEDFEAFDEIIKGLKDKKTVLPKTIEDMRRLLNCDDKSLEKSGFTYMISMICPKLKETLENEVFKKCIKDEQGNLKINSEKAIKIWGQAKEKIAHEVRFAIEHDDVFMVSLGPIVARTLGMEDIGYNITAAILRSNSSTKEVAQEMQITISYFDAYKKDIDRWSEQLQKWQDNSSGWSKTEKQKMDDECKRIKNTLNRFEEEVRSVSKEFGEHMNEMKKTLEASDFDKLGGVVELANRCLKKYYKKTTDTIPGLYDALKISIDNAQAKYNGLDAKNKEEKDTNKKETKNKKDITEWFSNQLSQLTQDINNGNDANCANLFKIEELKGVLREGNATGRPLLLTEVQFKDIHAKFIAAFTSVAGKYLDKRSTNYWGTYNDNIQVEKFLKGHNNEKNERKNFLKALLYYEKNVRNVYNSNTNGLKKEDIFAYYTASNSGGYATSNNDTFYYKELMYYYEDKGFNSYINNIDQGNGMVPIAYKMAKKLLFGEVKDDKNKEGAEACKAIGRFISLIARMLPEPFRAATQENDQQAPPQEVKSTQPTESAPAQPTEQPSDQISDN